MLGPGAIFGEMGPLTDAPRSATCIALTDSHIAELPYSALNAGLERGDRWATKFLIATARVLAQRLAALNKEAISVMAQLEESKSKVPAEDELERLRCRLLREWTFLNCEIHLSGLKTPQDLIQPTTQGAHSRSFSFG
jgi:CRP-like cAMP-binding protein